MNFNESQNLAIRHFRGPALVLAGPGSGKTAVITMRTRCLITEYGIDPSNILVITFTKAAANEMKQRFEQLMGHQTRVTFGTFHAVFFMVLKLAYHMTADNIITENQRYQLMRELISRHEIDYRDEKELIGSLLSEISRVKNSRLDLDKLLKESQLDAARHSGESSHEFSCDIKTFREIFREYDKRLRGSRLIDFDDMLIYTYELFDERKDILSAWQRKYQFILIDEFQDINAIQYDLIRMLALPENNLFIVGDDDQSIYRFRGAKPEIMLGFLKDYPQARQLLLDVNYRCDACVVEDALKLISHNQARFFKEIRAARPGKNPVRYRVFESEHEEHRFLLEIIEEERRMGRSWQDFAVLFRTNTQPRRLTELLLEHGVPFRIRDHVPNLYEHWIVRDLMTYIWIARGSRRRADFLQIMNRPNRFISRASLPGELVDFDEWARFYQEQDWIADRIVRMEYDARIMEGMSPFAAVNYIRHAIGYDNFLVEYAQRRQIDKEELIGIAEELQDTARGFRSFREWDEHIREYGEKLKKAVQEKNEQNDAVTLATLHSAKGLEFAHVFLLDVNEGVMPYKKALLDDELEEERRMFYVGMTRAKEQLDVCSTKEFAGKEQEISRFVEEARGDG